MTAQKSEKVKKNTLKRSSTRRRAPKEKTLAQIFKEQGVKPFDIRDNGKNWPKGADFQEFIAEGG